MINLGLKYVSCALLTISHYQLKPVFTYYDFDLNYDLIMTYYIIIIIVIVLVRKASLLYEIYNMSPNPEKRAGAEHCNTIFTKECIK